jgi:hypothetical protein
MPSGRVPGASPWHGGPRTEESRSCDLGIPENSLPAPPGRRDRRDRRRVDAKTGIITTVAGDCAADKASGGLGGFSGDGGPATSAQLNDPQGVAIDPSTGSLYVADTTSSKIAQVTGLAQSGNGAGPTAPAHP